MLSCGTFIPFILHVSKLSRLVSYARSSNLVRRVGANPWILFYLKDVLKTREFLSFPRRHHWLKHKWCINRLGILVTPLHQFKTSLDLTKYFSPVSTLCKPTSNPAAVLHRPRPFEASKAMNQSGNKDRWPPGVSLWSFGRGFASRTLKDHVQRHFVA